MEVQVKKVEMYSCPLCSATHVGKSKAEECLIKCEVEEKKRLKLERKLSNWDTNMNKLRLELDSIDELPKLLTEHIKRFFGAIVELRITTNFGDVSNSHSAPIGKKMNWAGDSGPTSYLGWNGKIAGKVLKGGRGKDNQTIDSISDMVDGTFRSGIKGIHTGTGGGGRNDFGYELRLYLDDFPKLKTKHEEYESLKVDANAYSEQLSIQEGKVQKALAKLCDEDVKLQEGFKKVQALSNQISELQKEKEKIQAENWNISEAHSAKVNSARDDKFPIPAKYKYDMQTLEKLKSMFKNRWY